MLKKPSVCGFRKPCTSSQKSVTTLKNASVTKGLKLAVCFSTAASIVNHPIKHGHTNEKNLDFIHIRKQSSMIKSINKQIEPSVLKKILSFIEIMYFPLIIANLESKLLSVSSSNKKDRKTQQNNLDQQYNSFNQSCIYLLSELFKLSPSDLGILIALYTHNNKSVQEVLVELVQRDSVSNVPVPMYSFRDKNRSEQLLSAFSLEGVIIAQNFLQQITRFQRIAQSKQKSFLSNTLWQFLQLHNTQDITNNAVMLEIALYFLKELEKSHAHKATVVHRAFVEELRTQHSQVDEPFKLSLSFPVTAPGSVSFTSLNTFLTCPVKYVYKYVFSIKDSQVGFERRVIGTALHAAVAHAAQQRITNSQHTNFEKVEQTYKEQLVKQGVEVSEKTIKKHVESLKAHVDASVIAKENDKNQTTLTEHSFVFKVGEGLPEVRGTWDYVHREGDHVVIKEFKSVIRPDVIVEENLQLLIYSLAYEKIHGIRPAKLVLQSLETRREKSFTATDEMNAKTEAIIRNVVQSLQVGKFEAKPHPSKCKQCEFRGVCPASAVFSKTAIALPFNKEDVANPFMVPIN